MKRLFVIMMSFGLVWSLIIANVNDLYSDVIESLKINSITQQPRCDTIIRYDGYPIRIMIEDGKISYIGLNLFDKNIKNNASYMMLDYIETELLKKVIGVESREIQAWGDFQSLKNISNETPCRISNLNSRTLSVEWEIAENELFRVDVPIGYDKANKGSRSQIEDAFIRKIQKSGSVRYSKLNISDDNLQSYDEDVLFLPGMSCHNDEITRDTYYIKTDSIVEPIWSLEYPCESIANLFIIPDSENRDMKIALTILKHEYGEKNEFSVGLEQFLAVCEEEGCVPFFGVEEFDGEILKGALFLYNWNLGYEHLLRIECNVDEIIDGNGMLNGVASLYIPTNNVQSLYE